MKTTIRKVELAVMLILMAATSNKTIAQNTKPTAAVLTIDGANMNQDIESMVNLEFEKLSI